MAADTNRSIWPAGPGRGEFPARRSCLRLGPAIAVSAVFGIVLSLALPATATEVYRWVDENGVTQFGQRPPPGGAERVEIRPAAAAGSALPDARRERQQRLLDAYAHERESRRDAAVAEEEARRERAGRCAGIRRHLELLDYGGPIYIETDDGGRDYLSEARRQAERERTLAVGARECKGVPGW